MPTLRFEPKTFLMEDNSDAIGVLTVGTKVSLLVVGWKDTFGKKTKKKKKTVMLSDHKIPCLRFPFLTLPKDELLYSDSCSGLHRFQMPSDHKILDLRLPF